MKRSIPLLAALAVSISACGGAPQVARRIVGGTALAVVAVDGPAADGYTAAHERAMERSQTRAEYDAAMSGWNDVERALRFAQRTVYAADAALDAWDAGGEEAWLGLAACIAVSLTELVEAAASVGLELPSEVATVIALVRPYASGVCPGRS